MLSPRAKKYLKTLESLVLQFEDRVEEAKVATQDKDLQEANKDNKECLEALRFAIEAIKAI